MVTLSISLKSKPKFRKFYLEYLELLPHAVNPTSSFSLGCCSNGRLYIFHYL